MHRIFKASNITIDTQKKAVDNSFTDSQSLAVLKDSEGEYNDVDGTDGDGAANSAEKTAERIIAQANRDASKILTDAKRDATAIKADAERNGREEGYKKGYAEGAEEGAKIRADAEELYRRAVSEHEETLRRIEPQMVELIVAIIKKLLNDAVEISPKAVQNLILQGLNETTLKGSINIRVSAEDYAGVVEGKEMFLSKVESGAGIEIIKDPALNKAECIIETPFGDVDCGLDRQFEGLKQNLYFICNGGGRTE